MIINSIQLNKISFCANKNIKHDAEQTPKNDVEKIGLSSAVLQAQDITVQKIRTQAEVETFLNRSTRLSKEEYEDIVKNHPEILIQANLLCQKYKGQIEPVDMAKTAIEASEYLNKRFNNHRIISIGTSPAALCEQLSLLGHDVVFIPISGLSKYKPNEDNIDDLPDLKKVIEYIKSKNLKDGKINIIIDYTSTGRTLDNFCYCMEKYCEFDWGDYVSMPIHQLLNSALDKNHSHEFENIKHKFKEDMTNSSIEDVSNVAHFPVIPSMKSKYDENQYTIRPENKTQEELDFEFDNFSRPLARAYSLCTFDEIQKLK